ncbi:FUSC family protein [Dyella sp.]|uniref:FUSC family protein n=1 Tax=Dyella sp. TaxID=1869338 RepID=UPI002ED52D98
MNVLSQESWWNRRWPWLAAFLVEERGAWVFVFKVLAAMYLAAWAAMGLQLEAPATSMITVVLVMHPHSGMVLAKSFYRALGTLAGSVFGLVLMGMFPQQRELFLFTLSLWVGLCAGGAMLYRNFMSYGFVLAGYTAAIVVLPAINAPLTVFDSAVMRVSEVMLGILVAGVVSDVIWPRSLRHVLRQRVAEHFAHFLDFARGSLVGTIAREDMEKAHLHFVRAAVELEDMRASVIFEDPEARARSRRMQLLNQHYMAAATSFQSLHHLINRLLRHARGPVAEALMTLYAPVGEALSPAARDQHRADVLAARLNACIARLPALAAQLRTRFEDAGALLEFDTGQQLLRRFADELHAFCALYATLRGHGVRGNVERAGFHRGNDYAGAAVAVLRTFLTMASLSVLWLLSGWSFGAGAMLLATVFSGLYATSARPLAATLYTWIGYALGMLAAFVVTFWLLPGSDGFLMLIAASAALLLPGPYLMTRATLPGTGVGYALGFVYILALKNPMTYDPVHFMNDAISQLAGLGLTGVAFVFVPAVTGSVWQRRRQLQRLRRQVVMAATAPLEGLLFRFESINRDLFQQITTYTRPGSDESRRLLAWALSVHECGRALIELRRLLADGEWPPRMRIVVDDTVSAVATLYMTPNAAAWERAAGAVESAIDAGMQSSFGSQPHGRAVLAQLQVLRGALHDEETAMAAYMVQEPPHAS